MHSHLASTAPPRRLQCKDSQTRLTNWLIGAHTQSGAGIVYSPNARAHTHTRACTHATCKHLLRASYIHGETCCAGLYLGLGKFAGHRGLMMNCCCTLLINWRPSQHQPTSQLPGWLARVECAAHFSLGCNCPFAIFTCIYCRVL